MSGPRIHTRGSDLFALCLPYAWAGERKARRVAGTKRRPWGDHRALIDGMLWVHASGDAPDPRLETQVSL